LYWFIKYILSHAWQIVERFAKTSNTLQRNMNGRFGSMHQVISPQIFM